MTQSRSRSGLSPWVSGSTATLSPKLTPTGKSPLCSSIDFASRFAGFGNRRSLLFQPSEIDTFGHIITIAGMVPRRRLELPRPCGHRYLKPARLPIPPPGPLISVSRRKLVLSLLGGGGIVNTRGNRNNTDVAQLTPSARTCNRKLGQRRAKHCSRRGYE